MSCSCHPPLCLNNTACPLEPPVAASPFRAYLPSHHSGSDVFESEQHGGTGEQSPVGLLGVKRTQQRQLSKRKSPSLSLCHCSTKAGFAYPAQCKEAHLQSGSIQATKEIVNLALSSSSLGSSCIGQANILRNHLCYLLNLFQVYLVSS